MFDELINKFNDHEFDRSMLHLGRLGNVGILLGCGIGLIKYSLTMSNEPLLGFITGMLVYIIAFIFLILVAVGFSKDFLSRIGNKWGRNLAYVAAIFCSVLLGVGLAASLL